MAVRKRPESPDMQWLTIKKGIYCALRPPLWPLLASRIAPAIEHIEALSRFSFGTVVDVGANRGQFAAIARRLFPAAAIYSFEPQKGPAAEFEKAFGHDRKTRLFNNAIGPLSRSAPIFVTSKDDSSSLLKPGATQSEIFGVGTSNVEQIAVRRLSECLAPEDLKPSALLKIDVQGGELDVLQGTEDLINRFDAVYVECSYLQLYEGQPLAGDVHEWMIPRGFRLAGVYNQYVNAHHGPVQADFLFLRSGAFPGSGRQ
jgi:FkbM family methyltransferase